MSKTNIFFVNDMRDGETKRSAFKRLAGNRTNNAIRNLKLIGNLSNRYNYSYSEKDYKAIFRNIEKELQLAKARFRVALNKNRKFKL